MQRNARRGQPLDTFASALASMAVFSSNEAGEAGKPADANKWRETASDVDERDGEEGESEDDAAAAAAVRWTAKAAARRRGSGPRALHVTTSAASNNSNSSSNSNSNGSKEAQAAYWRLFGAANGRVRHAQPSPGFDAYRKALAPREDSAEQRRRAGRRDPPSSTDDGSDDAVAARTAESEAPIERREPDDEVVLLREQVALLVQNLEKEKQRRTVEQNLMQTKIIELQGLIRRNLPEQQRALERRLQSRASPPASKARAAAAAARSAARAMAKLGGGGGGGGASHCHHMYHHHHFHHHEHAQKMNQPVCCEEALLERSMSMPTTLDRFPTPSKCASVGDAPDNQAGAESPRQPRGSTPRKSAAVAERMLEASMKKQMSKMRAKMVTAVAEAEREAVALRAQLAEEAKLHAQRERQLRLEWQVELAAVDDRQRRTAHKLAVAARQAAQFAEEKQQLAAMVNAQAECIRRLELAVSGRKIVEQAAASAGAIGSD